MKQRVHWSDSILIILFVYLLMLQVQAIWPFTIDDMYISLRYAKHWASGLGLLWNVHEPPVEGYSNFSFVVVGAIALLLNGDPVFILKIVGVLGLICTCFFMYLISRFWFDTRLSFFPILILLFYKGQIIWTASGLETTVYEALICGTVYFCFKGMGYNFVPYLRGKTHYSSFFFAGLLLSLAGLTRPEAPALMVLFFLLICWDKPKTITQNYWMGVAVFITTLVIFYLPYFLWRFYYFGYLFPNSVYCKGLTNTSSFVLAKNYLALIGPFVLMALPACLKAPDKRHYFLWLPSVIYLVMLIGADPIVAFDNRLFLPAFALFLPLVLQGISIIAFWGAGEKNYFFSVCIFLTFVICFFIPKMSLTDYRYFSQNPIKGEQLRSAVLNWLIHYAQPNDAVVLSDSGMIPYYSNLNFIDSYCLNNLSMAHYPAKKRYELFCQKILLHKPNIVILTSLLEQDKVIYTPSDACLKLLLEQNKDYQLKKSLTTKGTRSSYRYELYTAMP